MHQPVSVSSQQKMTTSRSRSRKADVSVSSRSQLLTSCAQDVIFDEIMQATLIKWSKSVIAIYGRIQGLLFLLLLLLLLLLLPPPLPPRDVVSVSTSRSRDCLKMHQCLISVSSQNLNVSVSGFNVSCPSLLFTINRHNPTRKACEKYWPTNNSVKSWIIYIATLHMYWTT